MAGGSLFIIRSNYEHNNNLLLTSKCKPNDSADPIY